MYRPNLLAVKIQKYKKKCTRTYSGSSVAELHLHAPRPTEETRSAYIKTYSARGMRISGITGPTDVWEKTFQRQYVSAISLRQNLSVSENMAQGYLA